MICKLIHTGKLDDTTDEDDTKRELLGYNEIQVESLVDRSFRFSEGQIVYATLCVECTVTTRSGDVRRDTNHWSDIEKDILNGYLKPA